MTGIYKISSITKPDMIYVGSAVDIKKRWKRHLFELGRNNHHSKMLQNHFNKYGEADLVFMTIEPCISERLLEREQYYIDTINPLFNVCKVAGSIIGFKHSEESIQKMKGKNRPHTEEAKQKMSNSKKGNIPWNKGKKGVYSDESIEKMRLFRIGKPSKKKGLKIQPHTAEHRKKLSEANRAHASRYKEQISK